MFGSVRASTQRNQIGMRLQFTGQLQGLHRVELSPGAWLWASLRTLGFRAFGLDRLMPRAVICGWRQGQRYEPPNQLRHSMPSCLRKGTLKRFLLGGL